MVYSNLLFLQEKGMKYTIEQKRDIFKTVEELMKKAKIEIRDTWNGFDGENYDDLIMNNYRTDGPKSIDFIKKADGLACFTPKGKNELSGFKSIAYEDSTIYIPERLANKTHPLVHEIVHFLQHTTLKLDDLWRGLKSQTKEDFTKFVSQRSELEAHFIQLLYIDKYELNLDDENLKENFKEKLASALNNPEERIELIVFAKENQIL